MVSYINNWISYCALTLHNNLMLLDLLFHSNRHVIFIVKYY